MISCAARHAARAATVPQLERAGLKPFIHLGACDPPTPRSSTQDGRVALRYAMQTRAPWTLFVEDDIDVAPNFRTATQDAAISGHDVIYLYINDTPQRGPKVYGVSVWNEITQGNPLRARVVPAVTYSQLYGSQAILMTRAAVSAALVTTLDATTAIDTTLNETWERHAFSVGVRVPHVVQHRHDRTSTGPEPRPDRPKRSASFGREGFA